MKTGRYPRSHQPGTEWRVLAQDPSYPIPFDSDTHPGSVLDELVIDHWIHLEQLDDDHWWIRLGPLTIDIHIGERGEAISMRIETDPQDHEDCLIDPRAIGGHQHTIEAGQ